MSSPHLEASTDRFQTACMTIFTEAGSNPDAPITMRQFGNLLTGLSDMLRDMTADLGESQAAIFSVRDAWYNMTAELGAGRDGRFPDST